MCVRNVYKQVKINGIKRTSDKCMLLWQYIHWTASFVRLIAKGEIFEKIRIFMSALLILYILYLYAYLETNSESQYWIMISCCHFCDFQSYLSFIYCICKQSVFYIIHCYLSNIRIGSNCTKIRLMLNCPCLFPYTIHIKILINFFSNFLLLDLLNQRRENSFYLMDEKWIAIQFYWM